MATTTGYYEIRHAVSQKHSETTKTWWVRIGSATLLDTGAIVATIQAIPINWDGTFHLFPSKRQPNQDTDS